MFQIIFIVSDRKTDRQKYNHQLSQVNLAFLFVHSGLLYKHGGVTRPR